MIYFTATDNRELVTELYKEWTGKEQNMNMITWNDRLVLAMDDKKVIGAAQIIIIPDRVWNRKWCLIENVFVTESYRGRGIGKGLMDFVEKYCLLCGEFDFIKLTSSKPVGQELYRSMGYEEGSSFKKRAQK